jgi:hypothetical protein
MRVVHTRPGTGDCSLPPNESGVLEQVVPTSTSIAEFAVSQLPGWQPLTGKKALYGSWFAEGGGYVLELARDGGYSVVDDSGDAIDRGQWSFRDPDLTLTSGAGTATCNAGDRLVLGGVEYVHPGTTAIRTSVRQNACGGAWATAVWILIPYEGS